LAIRQHAPFLTPAQIGWGTLIKPEASDNRKNRELTMENQDEGRKLAIENRPGDKPETCPKCGGKKISSCPGGSKLKAVPGIWWSCQDCLHEW
jgi:hypothetical protein